MAKQKKFLQKILKTMNESQYHMNKGIPLEYEYGKYIYIRSVLINAVWLLPWVSLLVILRS